ncbi:MAG: ABC transporter ATP-binding protein [Salinisphaeraceae bacterium]|nr:ABC transporter ATP-binding protein [Salinisphaeraceae bacterium]
MQQQPSITLAINGLAHAFSQRRVLELEHLEVEAGAQYLITGPSGCGKTTLLHAVAGLLQPSAGSVVVNGQDLTTMTESARDRFRGLHIGIVFQRLHLLQALTVKQNLLLAQYLGRRPQQVDEVEALLEGLGLAGRMDDHPSNLSLGEAQRVAIARALVNKPSLILADEPTSSLDDHNAETVIALLKSQAQKVGAALLVVTHDARLGPHFSHELQLRAPA